MSQVFPSERSEGTGAPGEIRGLKEGARPQGARDARSPYGWDQLTEGTAKGFREKKTPMRASRDSWDPCPKVPLLPSGTLGYGVGRRNGAVQAGPGRRFSFRFFPS